MALLEGALQRQPVSKKYTLIIIIMIIREVLATHFRLKFNENYEIKTR